MDSPTRASGVAVSVLVAATGSVLLLLPGHPGPRPGPGTGGGGAVLVLRAARPAAEVQGPAPAVRAPGVPAPPRERGCGQITAVTAGCDLP